RFNRVNVANGNRWVHNPTHRGGVPYNNRNVANRFQGAGGAGRNPATRPTVGQTQQRLGQSGMANRGGMPGTGGANRLGPGNAGRGGRGGGMPGQGNANRLGPGNAGRGGMGQPGQARPAQRPAQPGMGNMPSRGGANRMAPGQQF